MNKFKSIWNLRTKSMTVIGLILVAMVAALYIATDRILFSSFARVEKTTTERNVNRITDAINDEIQALSNYTSAYSVWDDTIDFIKNSDGRSFEENSQDEYVDSNITSATFETEAHNLFGFVSPQGKLVYDAACKLDYEKNEDGEEEASCAKRPVSESLRKYFTGASPLIKYKNESNYKNGFVAVDEGLMFLSIQPLVDSEGNPPIEGTVVTGKDFDDHRIAGIEDKTHLQFSVYRLSDPNLPAEVAEAKDSLTDDAPIFMKAPNKQIIYGYTTLKDINGEPLLILRAEVPREVFRQGLAARNYLVLSLLAIGIAFLAMALVLLTNLYRRDQEVQELKDRFIAIASHELRTPLTSIRGGADLLVMQKLPAESEAPIKLITDGIARLVRLTDELINVVTIERGQFKAKREDFNIVEMVREACYSLEGAATTKGIRLTCAVPPQLPAYHGDVRLLRSALTNLLDNAIKFTDKGGVGVKMEMRGDGLLIEVADTGPGIKDEAAHMLFKKFSKIASVRESFKEGHGLGLYLAKLAVEAHGGTIQVNSSTAGSVFTILLPLTPNKQTSA